MEDELGGSERWQGRKRRLGQGARARSMKWEKVADGAEPPWRFGGLILRDEHGSGGLSGRRERPKGHQKNTD